MRNPFSRRPVQQPAVREPLRPIMAAAQQASSLSATLLQSLQQPWQARARFFATQLGVVAFAQEITTSAGSRCRFVVQENIGGNEWAEVKNLDSILEFYRNENQSFAELMAAHMYRVGVDGDRYEVLSDGPDGEASYWVVPIDKVYWQGTQNARVFLAPNGTEIDGTAIALTSDRLVRMWTPSKDYPLLGTSPMMQVKEDCERYWSLIRYIRRTADSRLAMNKILITPEGAHVPLPPEMQRGGTTPRSELDVQMAQAATASFDKEDSLQGIMPFVIRYDTKLGDIKLVDLARGLEPAVLAALESAGRAVAQGLPLPAQVLMADDANHWSEWIFEERSFRWGIAPTIERVCNDLTRSFVRPTLRALAPGDPAIGDPGRFRLWYDPSAVIVHPDRTKDALPLNLAGLLAAIPTLEAYGYSANDLMSEAERTIWKDFRVTTRQSLNPADVPVGAGPANTVEAPPAAPPQVGSLGPFEAEMLSYWRN